MLRSSGKGARVAGHGGEVSTACVSDTAALMYVVYGRRETDHPVRWASGCCGVSLVEYAIHIPHTFDT